MTGNERREKLLNILATESEPMSASALAKNFGVSRQIIVGDVALLRAEGYSIFASPRGYIIDSKETNSLIKTIAVQHTSEQTEEELNICVDCGCKVIDVIVEHPLYGQISGQLQITSRMEVKDFIDQCKKQNAHSLCELTDGIHLHTIDCPSEAAYNQVVATLKSRGILLDEEM